MLDARRLLFQLPRILKYRLLSTCRNVTGAPTLVQPALFAGGGRIAFGRDVTLGCNPSPSLYSGYVFMAALAPESLIEVGDGTTLNNDAVLYSLAAGIRIGKRVLAGTHLEVYDSDFHPLDPARRAMTKAESRRVVIEDDVFLGSNVRVLKGVTIGAGSVVGNGAVVAKSCPPRTVLVGNPARAIRTL